jgi:hypothetical protein
VSSSSIGFAVLVVVDLDVHTVVAFATANFAAPIVLVTAPEAAAAAFATDPCAVFASSAVGSDGTGACPMLLCTFALCPLFTAVASRVAPVCVVSVPSLVFCSFFAIAFGWPSIESLLMPLDPTSPFEICAAKLIVGFSPNRLFPFQIAPFLSSRRP